MFPLKMNCLLDSPPAVWDCKIFLMCFQHPCALSVITSPRSQMDASGAAFPLPDSCHSQWEGGGQPSPETGNKVCCQSPNRSPTVTPVLKNTHTHTHTHTHTKMYMVVLFLTSKNWKQPNIQQRETMKYVMLEP